MAIEVRVWPGDGHGYLIVARDGRGRGLAAVTTATIEMAIDVGEQLAAGEPAHDSAHDSGSPAPGCTEMTSLPRRHPV